MPWVTHGGVFRHTRQSSNLRFNKSVSSQIVRPPHVVKRFGSLDEVQLNFLKTVFLAELKPHGLVLARGTSLKYWNFIYVPKNSQVLGSDNKISSFSRAFLPIILLPARACQANDLQEKSSLQPDSLCYLLLQQRLKLNDAAWVLRSCCSPNCLASLKWQKIIMGLPWKSGMFKRCQLPWKSLLSLKKV